MTERISLAEAYNNKDVITQIAILKDKLDSIPDADLMNVVLKTGDQVIDGKKTFNDPIVANGGVVFANSGIHVNGTLEVDGDIIQNGSAYETHAEQVFSKNDLIVTREDAIGAISVGQLSGIRVKKYDGVSDLNLGVDSDGVMRVGNIADEQPLATRDEAAAMTSGALVKWDGVNKKMIAPKSSVGSDVRPIKIVDGIPVIVANDLALDSAVVHNSGDEEIYGEKKFRRPISIGNENVSGRISYFYSNDTYMGVDLITGKTSQNDHAGLRVSWNNTTKKITLELFKEVNGEYSSKFIDDL